MYAGETICNFFKKDGTPCKYKAYYVENDKPACGRHSTSKVKLPRNKQKAVSRTKEELESAEIGRRHNEAQNAPSKVICDRLRMMARPPMVEGFLRVFPNSKHVSRIDGVGLPGLSPKTLGPVNHGQPGLEPARTLEGFHQFNKVYQFELNSEGKLTDEFDFRRSLGYQNLDPTRYKFGKNKTEHLKHLAKYKMKMDAPLFSVIKNSEGEMIKYSYVESRYWYCTYYADLVVKTEDWKKLCDLVDKKYNLLILGYDGYNPDKPLMEHYLDPTRPFGHELVLYSMLTAAREQWPWVVNGKPDGIKM